MRLERRQFGRTAPPRSLPGLARLTLAVLVLGLLASCGGGGGGSSSVPFSTAPPPPTITTTSLDDGVNGQAYSVNINASGGTLPLTWRETTSSFDDTTGLGVGSCAGLTLDLSATGRTTTISGTPTTTGTCGPFTIEIQDSATPPRTDTQDLSIAIFDPLTITTSSLPNGTEDQVNYLATINATGGNGPFTWTRSTNVPPGLDLTASTTASVDLTGDPTSGGAFTFTVQVDDSANPAQSATRQFTVRILQVTTAGLPDAVENQLYSSGPLTAVGLNPLATPTWGATGLPAGFTINTSTGEITGTPTTAQIGNHPITVSITDSFDARTDTQNLTVRVVAALVITTTALPDGQENTAYNQAVSATGGTAPYTWSEPTAFFSDTTGAGAIGTACEGLTFDLTATGLSTTISGTPPNDGDCGPFTVRIDDVGSPGQFDEQQLTITVNVGPVTILTTSLPDGAVNSAYSANINATGGLLPYTWSETTTPTDFFSDTTGQGALGTACEGLTLDLTATSSPTTITGTPVNEGTCGPFDITVTDSQGVPDSDIKSLSITVIAAPLGRNDTIATATALTTAGDLTISASISPYADPVDTANPDNDFYELTATAGNVVMVEITARRLPSPSPLDSIIEIVDSGGTRFSTCRNEGNDDGVTGAPDSTPLLFDDVCLNDDIELGVILDSKLEFQVPGAGTVTFFIRVLDFRGDARPDMVYQLRIIDAD